MKIWVCICIVIAFSIDPAAVFPQKVYKYVDKDGVVHFTDTPVNSKYCPTGTGETESDRLNRRTQKFEGFIDNTNTYISTDHRDQENRKMIYRAFELVRLGLARPETENSDNEFLDIIDKAVFGYKDYYDSKRGSYVRIYRTDEGNTLLEKARVLKNIPSAAHIEIINPK